MEKDLGKKIKKLRLEKKMTLKALSEKAGLSVGFLSQLERGLTSTAITTLNTIAGALDVDLSYFLAPPKQNNSRIIRSYEREIYQVQDDKFIYYNLENTEECNKLTPMIITILPEEKKTFNQYTHDGEEFLYVIEGILTVYIDNEKKDLHPGDTLHIKSSISHDWHNLTNKIVRILTVNTPQIFEIEKNAKN